MANTEIFRYYKNIKDDVKRNWRKMMNKNPVSDSLKGDIKDNMSV